MSYRKATIEDLDKNITQFFEDDRGQKPANAQPNKDNITNYYVLKTLDNDVSSTSSERGGSRRRRARRPSRKYKKSAKRVFRKKSRSTRQR
jgi:hypothetical protein